MTAAALTVRDAYLAALRAGARLYWWHERVLTHVEACPGQLTAEQLAYNVRYLAGDGLVGQHVVEQLLNAGALRLGDDGRLHLAA